MDVKTHLLEDFFLKAKGGKGMDAHGEEEAAGKRRWLKWSQVCVSGVCMRVFV